MTSDPTDAFVWVWLPTATEPVVAGRLHLDDGVVSFAYGRSYLAREEAIPLYLPELALRRGPIAPAVGAMAGCIADAGPDAWGRRVIVNRRATDPRVAAADPNALALLLDSGSDRIGALGRPRHGDRTRGVCRAGRAGRPALTRARRRAHSRQFGRGRTPEGLARRW
jgi:serine/threonine-protein kinase HipA